MAERLRIIERSGGGRPVTVLDLNDETYRIKLNSFTYQPGDRGQLLAREPSRYGGRSVVGEFVENGTITWDAMLSSISTDALNDVIEMLVALIEVTASGRLLEWRRRDTTYSSYFRIAGPGSWLETYAQEYENANRTFVRVQFPVNPLILWDEMRIVDGFTVDSSSDYTFDALTADDVTIGAGKVAPVSSLTSARRVRHTARGYGLLEGQVTLRTTPAATITGYKAGVLLRAFSLQDYLEVYVDDDGTHSRLRIDVVIAGTRTNRASTNLGSRLTAGTPVWAQARLVGQTITAEFFADEPLPTIDPDTTNSYTLNGTEQDAIGSVGGFSGWSWVPQHASATLDSFEFRPFTQGDVDSPATVEFLDGIPGTAPALADIVITHNLFGEYDVNWALLAWSADRAGALGVYDSDEADSLVNWASVSDANGLGGHIAKATTTGSAGTYTASWELPDLPDLQPDDFTDGRCELEVWARVSVAATLSSPRLALALVPFGSGGYGLQYASPFGSAGAALTTPASGTVRRMVRLGTINVPADSSDGPGVRIDVTGSVAAGGSGELGLDYLFVVPVNRRSAGPTGVPNDGTYPRFMTTGAKTTRSDLSGLMQVPTATRAGDAHGLGGSLIQIVPQSVEPYTTSVYVKLADLVPDDPTSDTTSETLAIPFDISVDVTPRSYLVRGA